MILTKLTKLAVARRQLATAVRLHFGQGDPVSVYTLAGSAWEIIDTLCTRANIASFSNDTRANVPEGRDLKQHYINPSRNFFKHADRDPEGVLDELIPANVDGLLFLAVHDYSRLAPAAPIEFQVYEGWYIALYPAKLKSDELATEMELLCNGAFPGLTTLDRIDQLKMGAEVLAQFELEPEIVNDPRTEPAF